MPLCPCRHIDLYICLEVCGLSSHETSYTSYTQYFYNTQVGVCVSLPLFICWSNLGGLSSHEASCMQYFYNTQVGLACSMSHCMHVCVTCWLSSKTGQPTKNTTRTEEARRGTSAAANAGRVNRLAHRNPLLYPPQQAAGLPDERRVLCRAPHAHYR